MQRNTLRIRKADYEFLKEMSKKNETTQIQYFETIVDSLKKKELDRVNMLPKNQNDVNFGKLMSALKKAMSEENIRLVKIFKEIDFLHNDILNDINFLFDLDGKITIKHPKILDLKTAHNTLLLYLKIKHEIISKEELREAIEETLIGGKSHSFDYFSCLTYIEDYEISKNEII